MAHVIAARICGFVLDTCAHRERKMHSDIWISTSDPPGLGAGSGSSYCCSCPSGGRIPFSLPTVGCRVVNTPAAPGPGNAGPYALVRSELKAPRGEQEGRYQGSSPSLGPVPNKEMDGNAEVNTRTCAEVDTRTHPFSPKPDTSNILPIRFSPARGTSHKVKIKRHDPMRG